MSSLKYRLFKNKLLTLSVVIFSALTAVPLVLIIGKVFLKGWRQINWDFFTKTTPTTLDALLAINNNQPIPGGIANGIVGTLMMVLVASVIAIPLGVMCGIYLSENRKTKFSTVVRFLTDLLQGTPSIILGIIAYLWVVIPLKGYSALAGSVALAIMMLPLIVRSTEETMNLLPASLKEAGLALGSPYRSVVLKVLLPSAFGGVFTGILLAVSRVIGETAPLMLTALGATTIQWDITKPASAVSLLIWEFYNDPNLQSMIWSASLFLLLLVLSLNILAKQLAKKWRI
ncbi:MAG: phosphate ABC transporter permease PstA [Bacteroidales bacterium]|jgi:phosphate transport system permease protein|nr:phosphate ABC transporter permease PstA [Bacteroidales bacterium]MDI9545074.1 phosphate ABC transporter permease PstA [Bacteroidota bacterium]OQC03224.1 MAG: Phosphate transport system permease protein PstA [Bacteroidetes bacterium ADurb.Bin090]MBP8982741.1 phosphate ABC transporter permease PstA [Bacteroidales bacterium]NLV38817.1 phosphate ABC transporter permease PstA [Bacteroidales bacterium]